MACMDVVSSLEQGFYYIKSSFCYKQDKSSWFFAIISSIVFDAGKG